MNLIHNNWESVQDDIRHNLTKDTQSSVVNHTLLGGIYTAIYRTVRDTVPKVSIEDEPNR
jgi:hypothetical protein